MSKFLKAIVNVILFCSIVVAAGLLIPPFAGVTTVMVDDVDMQTNLSQGAVAYAVEKDGSELKVGDKVLISRDGGQYVYMIDSLDGTSAVLDDQLSVDGGILEQELTGSVQKVVLVVPVIGYVSMALRSTEGLIIVALAVVFVIILFILAEVWKDDDDEDDEDEEENEDEEDGYDESESIEEDDADESEESETLSRRERKRLKKEEKKKQKEERKQAKKKNKKADGTQDAESKEDLPPVKEWIPEQEEAAPVVHKTDEPEREPDGADQFLFEETASMFAADIANMMKDADGDVLEDSEQNTESEEAEVEVALTDPIAVDEQSEVLEDEKTESTDSVEVEEIEEEPQEKKLAMPIYTKEELLEKAQQEGDEPEVIEDEVSGVTLLDYSDVL